MAPTEVQLVIKEKEKPTDDSQRNPSVDTTNASATQGILITITINYSKCCLS